MESQIVIFGISFVSRKSFICRRQGNIRPTQRLKHHSSLKSFYEYQSILKLKMSYFCIACQKEVDGRRHAISCGCVSDGSIGFVRQVFIYLICHYFAITFHVEFNVLSVSV